MKKSNHSLKGKTYWLVGASTGIGEALAYELDKRGATLVLSARSTAKLSEIASNLDNPASVLGFDLTDREGIASACSQCVGIDGVIYMAGDYTPINAKEWQEDKVEEMFKVNFLGACRLLSILVPVFAKRNCGHIVIVGSIAGFSGLPGAIGYSASKTAIMHLAENLRCDLRDTDVQIQVANPGFVRTRLTAKNDFRMPFILTTEAAATCIANHMETSRFSTSFPKLLSWYFKLRALGALLRA